MPYPAGARRRSWPAWIALVVVVAERTVVALSRLDDQAFQFHTGNIAVCLLNGLPMDVRELPIISHNRGSMVAGFFAVPFVAVLGNTLLALKCEAIALSGITAFLFARVLDRHVGRAAAWCGAALYALLPPSFQMLDVMAVGSHVDTVLLYLAPLAWLLSWPRGEPATAARAGALGLLVGAGIFLSFHLVVVLPALLLAWWAADRRFLLRPSVLAFAGGAALAFAPSLLFVGSLEEAGNVVNRPLASWLLPPGEAAAKLADSVLVLWPGSWLFDLHGGAWARWLTSAAVLGGLALSVPRVLRREPAATFFVAYPFLLLAAYSVTDFRMNLDGPSGLGARHVTPAFPCLAAWVAMGSQTLRDRGPRLAAAGLAAPTVAAGLAGTLALVDLRVPLSQPPVRGTKLAHFKSIVRDAAGGDPLVQLEWIERLEPDWSAFRPWRFTTFEWPRETWDAPEDFEADVRLARESDPRLAPYYVAHLGRLLGRVIGPSLGVEEEPGRRFEELDLDLTDAQRVAFLRGFGDALFGVGGRQQLRRRALGRPEDAPLALYGWVAELSEPDATAVAEGMGFHFGYAISPYHWSLPATLAQADRLPRSLQGAFFRGMGWGYRYRFVERTYEPPTHLRLFDLLSPHQLRAFRAGLAWDDLP